MSKPNLKHFKELESTNTYGMKNLSTLNDMDIIIASKQTGGRGQFDRKWVSNKNNNVYMSIVLKPFRHAELDSASFPLTNFSQYMSVVICRVLADYGINAKIKWPNDVLVNGKKIAGILCESSIQGKKLKGIVIGIGINLNLEQDDIENIDQPATALNLLVKKPVDKDLFIDGLVCEFIKNYELFLNQGFLLIEKEYTEKSLTIAK
ncbi:MAG: biotin--[acetyl-CoA-carboxylase] ligase [Candidatus Gastranaerophilaceae bacterium]|jgi:BirA family biotin operon repressor/biotin-[acetyl-CoA-carboxylase] ligase